MNYFVYIIYSTSKDKYYAGHTQDINVRINDHISGRSGYTKGVKDWRLMWMQEYQSRSEAMRVESKIKKKKNRKYIEYLINQDPIS